MAFSSCLVWIFEHLIGYSAKKCWKMRFWHMRGLLKLWISDPAHNYFTQTVLSRPFYTVWKTKWLKVTFDPAAQKWPDSLSHNRDIIGMQKSMSYREEFEEEPDPVQACWKAWGGGGGGGGGCLGNLLISGRKTLILRTAKGGKKQRDQAARF